VIGGGGCGALSNAGWQLIPLSKGLPQLGHAIGRVPLVNLLYLPRSNDRAADTRPPFRSS
jgi:hypothetical protein